MHTLRVPTHTCLRLSVELQTDNDQIANFQDDGDKPVSSAFTAPIPHGDPNDRCDSLACAVLTSASKHY